MSFCIECGAPLNVTDRFCHQCGAVLSPAPEPVETAVAAPAPSEPFVVSRPLPQKPSSPPAIPDPGPANGVLTKGSQKNRLAVIGAGCSIFAILLFSIFVVVIGKTTRESGESSVTPVTNPAAPPLTPPSTPTTSPPLTPPAPPSALTPPPSGTAVSPNPPGNTPDATDDPEVLEAMASADAFYFWYLNKWEEPDLEPEWFETSEFLSPGFRRAWKQLQEQTYRENEGVGLDYDPVVGSQNLPPGGFRAVHGEPAGQPGLVRVIMLGVGWDFFLDLVMRHDEASGTWLVDAIDSLNRGDVVSDPVEIPAERRAAATLEVFLELMALGEPWQAYELTSTGFQRRADIDRFRAFPDSASFPPRRTPASRRLSGDGFRQDFAIEVGEGSRAILIDEAGESIWSVHHLRIGTHEIGVSPGPALEVEIGAAVMGTGRDPAGGEITGQDYVFDAAGREPVSVDIPLSNGFPGLSLELSVLSAEFGQTLLETVVPVPADAGAETVVRWEMPRAGRSWQGGDYQLVIRVPDGPVRKEVFGLR